MQVINVEQQLRQLAPPCAAFVDAQHTISIDWKLHNVDQKFGITNCVMLIHLFFRFFVMINLV